MRLTSAELIDLVLDPGSWESWDQVPDRDQIPETYAAEIEAAEIRSGQTEAVVTGTGTRGGRRVVVIAGEFGFLGGSIGVDAARRITVAMRRATQLRLPLLAAPASGGTRMQEGTAAFVRMVDISLAVTEHKAAGLPFIVYLRHPTTGGVMASYGSLGHVTVGEPGALVGFLGPRVYEAIYGKPFPSGVQTTENLFAKGIIDAVVAPADLGPLLERVLQILQPSSAGLPVNPVDDPTSDVDTWESVQRSRRSDRPGVRELLHHAATDVIPLSGSGQGDSDPGLLLAFARFGDSPCVLLGQDRHGQTPETPLGPGALREARRGMRLAAELKLPLLTVIDTPGAALTVAAEEGGLAGEIARSLADLVSLQAPTLTLILGQGTGGGALALLPADRVIAAEHGWLSPLPPEGASAIVHRDIEHADEMARAQGIRSLDLLEAGVVDRIVAERPDAADEPEAFLSRLAGVLHYELAALLAQSPAERTLRRRARYGG